MLHLKKILKIILFVESLKCIQACQIENESCKCKQIDPKKEEIQMDCFKEELLPKSLNLNALKTVENKTLILNIQNKWIAEIQTSAENHFINKIVVLAIKNSRIKEIMPNTFEHMTALTELTLNQNELQVLNKDSLHGVGACLKKLKIDANKIKRVQRGVFHRLIALEYLDLAPNEIELIEPDAFKDLHNLKILYLSNNNLNKISIDVLNTLNSLEVLWLHENVIELLEVNSLDGLTNLKYLTLDSNKIQRIETGTFKNLSKLELLYLTENELVEIKTKSFVGLANLNSLFLNINKIRVIRHEAFFGLNKLEVLNLQQNEISTIDANSFAHMPSLKQFNLHVNKILKLENFVFKNHFNLSLLNLSHNNLLSISRSSFVSVDNLDELDLSHNYLDGFNEFAFENLNFDGTLYLNHNYVKRLAKDFFSNGLFKLKELYLTHNDLKFIEDFSFKSLICLTHLFLDVNSLAKLNENSFFNLTQLNKLSLSYNQIRDLRFVLAALSHLRRLESIDLANNLLEFVEETSFNFSLHLKAINLSSNFIKRIHSNSFKRLNQLSSFAFSQNSMDTFDMSILNWETLQELDLSFNRLSFDADSLRHESFEKMREIRAENVSLLRSNASLEIFLNSNIKTLDFSNNYFKMDSFKMFDNLSRITSMRLKNTHLHSMSEINFRNLKQLTRLDLSFNYLTRLAFDSFEFLLRLEYLDLGFNLISSIDAKIFNNYEFKKSNPLEYLNLQHNRIVSIESTFTNYFNLRVICLSHNLLEKLFEFNSYWSGVWTPLNNQIYINHNNISVIKQLPIYVNTIEILNFDFNCIASIDYNAFFNSRSVKNLSLAHNYLANITSNNMYYLISLEFLNVSSNRIEAIESDAFTNLNKLIRLDLSYNRLKSIEADIFKGLLYLNDLYLLNTFEFELKNQSLSHLDNVGNIHLNASMIRTFKCLIVQFSVRRNFTRIIKTKYKFFKSINLLTDDLESSYYDANQCELKFSLFQFRIHFELKSDYENELFYEKCRDYYLINKLNSFYNNYKKCFNECAFLSEKTSEQNGINQAVGLFSDYKFYFIMSLVLSLFSSILLFILSHLYLIFKFERKREYIL